MANSVIAEQLLDASSQVPVDNLFLSIHTPSRHSERRRISPIGSPLIFSGIDSSKERVYIIIVGVDESEWQHNQAGTPLL